VRARGWRAGWTCADGQTDKKRGGGVMDMPLCRRLDGQADVVTSWQTDRLMGYIGTRRQASRGMWAFLSKNHPFLKDKGFF
jgi:hypothetical protein